MIFRQIILQKRNICDILSIEGDMNKKSAINILKFFGFLLLVGGLAFAAYEAYIMFEDGSEKIETLNIILAAVGAFLAVLGIVLFSVGGKISKKTCKKCGTPLNLCAYEWVLVKLSNTHAPDNSLATRVASYQITATCPRCQKKRVYNQEFTVFDYRNGMENNATMLIENWCKEKFGH